MSIYAPSAVATASPSTLAPALQRVLVRVRLRARRRAAWLQKLWSDEGATGGAFTVTHAEIATHLDDRDSPEAEAAWFAADESVALLNSQLAQVETAINQDDDSRLAQLQVTFGLRATEIDILHACVAVAIDPPLARVFAYLQDHARRGYVTEALVARLFDRGRILLWGAESPLRRWEIVRELEAAPGEPSELSCDRQIRNWLLGDDGLDEPLIAAAAFKPALPPLEGWPVAETAGRLARLVNGEQPHRTRVRVTGPPGSGRRTLAACISAELGLPLLAVDADQIADGEWRRVFIRAQRQAYLGHCALAWHGEGLFQRTWPSDVACFPVQFVVGEPGQAAPMAPDVVDYRLEMPLLSLEERRNLWQQLLPAAAAWPAAQFEALLRRHRVRVGEIASVARREVGGPAEAATLVRQEQRRQLAELTQPLECPFTWDDLVVKEHLCAALQEFVYEARERVAFWERPAARRLFPQGKGLLALFSGPPGTGKTMAAQVVAADLGLDLFRIDLSTVVSKYVGETSQNLERILSRAAQMDVVLLFDEADALFGKRTEVKDAHDRFANTDTGYLLQAIESYEGVAVLATNKKGNIDAAFIRRLRYVLDFSKPDAAQRELIWRKIVGELAGTKRMAVLNGGLSALAARLELTGAQIKFAVLAAIFIAQADGQPLAMPHLLGGVDRELMKEGRALSDRERDRLLTRG